MTEKTKENIHQGHRERLTDLVLSSGIDSVSDVQSVEFFLTYIFPRGDVNPLAHRLLKKYGSFANIIDAEIFDLSEVEGINTRSAKKIKLFGQMIEFYSLSKINRKVNLKNTGEFLDLIESLLKVQSTENLFLFAIDNNFCIIQKRKLDMKKVRAVGINPMELYNFISSTNPAYLVVCHNHPNGSALPSTDDKNAVIYIEQLLKHIECDLLDSFIVGKDGIYSEYQESFVRTYSTTQTKKVQ